MLETLQSLPLLSLTTFIPLIGAVIIAFIPSDRLQAIRWAALATALIAWVVSMLVLAGFDPNAAGFQFREQADWVPAFGIQYKLGVDGISLALVVLTTTLTWVSILASFSPIVTRVKEYMIAFLILEVGMIGVFLALDLFLFYIFFEIVLIPMYLIIGIWGGANRVYATIKFVIYTLVGSLLMLVAILATAYAYQATTGAWAGAFDYENLRGFGFDPTLQFFAFIGFFLAFAIKVPMFPFHTWLPDAHVEAPTAGSVILAGVLLKLGGYGLLRFAVPLFPDAAARMAPLVIVLSLIGIVYGAIVALVQPDLKKLVAYSSVSHMGFVTLGIFVFTEQGLHGAMMQMIAHGVITGALFLCVGVIYERTHDRTIAKMGGLAGSVPVWAAIFGFFVLASLGLPGLAGFVGEFLVIIGSFDLWPVVAAVAALAMMLAAAYLLWMYQRVVFGDLSEFLTGIGHHLTDMNRWEVATLAPLVVLAIGFGVFPGLLTQLWQTPVSDLVAQVAPAARLAAGLP
jgi:NADH-quinone oxidoreductase subunit M